VKPSSSAIEAIIKAARTGKIGDGKIFVSSVEQVVPDSHRGSQRSGDLTGLRAGQIAA